MRITASALILLLGCASSLMSQTTSTARPRAREAGVVVGILQPGPRNAITDVPGVRVGHTTVIEGDSVRTGVTAILPHGGNLFHERVPAAVHVVNSFGKLIGALQVEELGELETPILLTCTLCVWRAADALADWLLRQPGMERVRSINPVVGETNDGTLSDIRARPLRAEHVVRALESAHDGAVEEGAVGAGTGTMAFGWKGGIGTSSRRLPTTLGGYTVGALVQTNFPGILTINGAPVGRELGRFALQRELSDTPTRRDDDAGSIMIVVATDAPLESRNLERLARRALAGLARTGAILNNGGGDYVIAFSTAESLRRRTGPSQPAAPLVGGPQLANDAVTPLFHAVAEATEEAIYNALFRATTMQGRGGATAEALPLDRTLEVLRRYNALHWDQRLPPQQRQPTNNQ